MLNYIYFLTFWLCQIGSSILFKFGGQHPKYHWHTLIIGNIILLIASWFLVKKNKNVKIVVCKRPDRRGMSDEKIKKKASKIKEEFEKAE